MPFEYKCQACQAIGDLDSFVNQIECPNCGGVMTPAATPPPPQPPPAAASKRIDEGETPTTIVPRSEILKEMAATADQPRKVVKIAKIVNIGFGGMLTTSATRGFKPITPGRKDAGLPFSQQSSFSQQPQTQSPPPEKEAIPGEQTAKKQVSSSSTSLGSQRKKPFMVSKFKKSAFSPHQTSTQNMDATQIDPGIALSNQQQQVRLKRKQEVQPPDENPPSSQGILPKSRISGLTSTSTSLKFLPKGAMKVAQTHTAIQHSQIPLPPPELQAQPQQQTTSQYAQQPSRFPDQDEDFTEQVRIAAERQEAILREAYRIAERKILKEREETEKSSAQKKAGDEEDVQAKKHAEKTEQAARIAKELAETEELIRKELETLELRKEKLREIRKSAEEETAKAKTQDSKIILLSSPKNVKLKSGEGSESLMRSSKNLQIDKAMLETGKMALRKEELEKKDSKSDAIAPFASKDRKEDTDKSIASDIGKAPAKDRTPTKVGINADAPMTNSTLVKIQQKKKTVILFIVGFAVLVACLLIFFIGGEIAKTIKSSFSPSPVAVPPAPTQAPYDIQNSTNTDSSLRTEYNTVYQKIKKNPANKQEIDDNIMELQTFIDGHQNSPDTDKYIKEAKEHIRTMQDMKELY